jgi:putative peptidoglycan lipid II flippase
VALKDILPVEVGWVCRPSPVMIKEPDSNPPEVAASQAPGSSRKKASLEGSSFLVASGILLSRLAGLVRDRVFAHYFGNSDAADAFRAAFRIPNFLQNLFGEGVLSASFIPVYSKLLAQGDEKVAGRVAGGIAAILSLVVSLLVLLGVWTTPWLIDVIAPGFTGEKRELTIQLVRIFFPGAGVLVMSAWCLGILNSHHRFFLSYTAPVIWNVTIIAVLLSGGRQPQYTLAAWAAWGSVAGSLFQLLAQIPVVWRLTRNFRFALAWHVAEVQTVIKNFVPVFFSRGVVQISAYIDSLISSLLPTGAVAGLSYAQTLYTLPVSLFGMSVSAAELPAMSSALGNPEEIAQQLRRRLESGLRQIAFFIIPSTVAFITLGDVVAATIYQSGRFTHEDALFVWGILAGSSLGMLASTLGRLYSSTYYALRDTRTPLYFALLRVLLATSSGYYGALHLPELIGMDRRWGIAGLTLASGLAAMIEYLLLRRTLNRRIGATRLPVPLLFKLWGAALLSSAAAWLCRWLAGPHHPLLMAVYVLIPYALVYLTATWGLGVPEAQRMKARLLRAF